MTITSVEQEYKFIESQQDYKTEIGMIYRGRGILIDIGKIREYFNKDRKPQCFNTEKLKKEQNTKKYYKYDKMEHIVKDCGLEQKIKNHSIQKETDDENNNKQESFNKGPE